MKITKIINIIQITRIMIINRKILIKKNIFIIIMIIINKTFYYYLILFSIFLISFSFIPLTFEILQQKLTSNIPYSTLICLIIAFLIFLFISINRQYYIHIFFYLVGLICISIILYLKTLYNNNNILLYENE